MTTRVITEASAEASATSFWFYFSHNSTCMALTHNSMNLLIDHQLSDPWSGSPFTAASSRSCAHDGLLALGGVGGRADFSVVPFVCQTLALKRERESDCKKKRGFDFERN